MTLGEGTILDPQRILDEVPPTLHGPMTRRLLEPRAAGEPVVEAVNGGAGLTLGDDESFERFLALVEQVETIESVRAGLKYFADGGRGISLDDSMKGLRRDHDCPV